MSDHPGNQLVVRDALLPVCGQHSSLLHQPCVAESPLGSWRHSFAPAAPCYSALLEESVYVEREDVEMASSSLELDDTNVIASSLDIMAFGSEQTNLADTMVPLDCSRLQRSYSNQLFRGLSDCPHPWIQNNAGTRSSLIIPDQIPEPSRRLIAGPDATCMASSGLEPTSLLQPSSAYQSLAGNMWSVPIRSSRQRGRFPEPGHGLGIVNLQDSVTQYPIDPAFAERAAKFCSLRREADSELSTSPPLDDSREINCRDGAFKTRPEKLISLASSCSSQALSALLSDRRIADFALAPTRDDKAPKNEILDESTSAGGESVDEDRRLSGNALWHCSPYALVEEKPGASQPAEHQTKLFDEHSSGTRSPIAQSSEEEADALDCVRSKRVRTAQSEERAEFMQGKDGKNGARVRDLSLKRPKSRPISKRKEEPKMENDKARKNNDSGEESSPKARKGKATELAEAPKLDYIHVRARRGQATDSHSLAERVRREKISERMRFLQDLVPGCSKITGKAMMLDEIINYVQSLQQQVEFLAMKLAALNPRLDINVDSFSERQIDSVLGEINGAVSELAASAGPQISTNYRSQIQSVPIIQPNAADEGDYGVPTGRRIATEDWNRMAGIFLGSYTAR